MCDMTHSYVTWLIYMCDMTNSYVSHETYLIIEISDTRHAHDSFICVTWLIHMWHDSFICVTWLIHMWHDSFICVTWLIHMCPTKRVWWSKSAIHDMRMTHSYVWHDTHTSYTGCWFEMSVSFLRNDCVVAHTYFALVVCCSYLTSAVVCCLYGVATVSRIDKITGLFGRISSLLWGAFAKETYNLIDPTNRSPPRAQNARCMCVLSLTCGVLLFCRRSSLL